MDFERSQKAFAESWRLRREKRFREAELVLHEALAQFGPGNRGRAYNRLEAALAEVLLRQGKSEEASETALAVLARDPAEVIALTVLGETAMQCGQPAAAVENLMRAYECSPSSYRAGRLARALEENDQLEKALAVLREALKQCPTDSYLLRHCSRLREKAPAGSPSSGAPAAQPPRAGAEEEAGMTYALHLKARLDQLEPAQAAAQLEKMIKVGRRRKNPHLHALLGDLERRAGRETEAIAAYQEVLALDPGNLYALAQLLYCYRRLGQKEKAWPLFKLLLAEKPGDRAAKASFVKDAVELDRIEEALIFFDELIHRYPHHKELYGVIRRLRKIAASREEQK